MKNDGDLGKLTAGLLVIALFVMAYNALQLSDIKNVGGSGITAQAISQPKLASVDVVPKGTPAIYENELKISFDDVAPSKPDATEQAINILAAKDTGISLEGDDLKRYIAITTSISREYCCGADAIAFSNGEPACGCAHSYAMRGLAKYLIKNHGSEYTNEQILEELGKWKTLFFPAQISAKAAVLQDKGIELNYVNLASNKYRGVEKDVSGGMVGGC